MRLKNAVAEIAKLAERFQEVLNRWRHDGDEELKQRRGMEIAAEERFAGWTRESE
jgi:hypothetical protein